jgi:hypothetical protein
MPNPADNDESIPAQRRRQAWINIVADKYYREYFKDKIAYYDGGNASPTEIELGMAALASERQDPEFKAEFVHQVAAYYDRRHTYKRLHNLLNARMEKTIASTLYSHFPRGLGDLYSLDELNAIADNIRAWPNQRYTDDDAILVFDEMMQDYPAYKEHQQPEESSDILAILKRKTQAANQRAEEETRLHEKAKKRHEEEKKRHEEEKKRHEEEARGRKEAEQRAEEETRGRKEAEREVAELKAQLAARDATDAATTQQSASFFGASAANTAGHEPALAKKRKVEPKA